MPLLRPPCLESPSDPVPVLQTPHSSHHPLFCSLWGHPRGPKPRGSSWRSPSLTAHPLALQKDAAGSQATPRPSTECLLSPLGALAPGQSSLPPLSTAPCVRLVCSLSIPPSLPGAAPRACTQARSEGKQPGLAVSQAHGPQGDGHGGTALPGQALGFLPWPERARSCEPETPGPVSRGLSAGRCSRHPIPGLGSHTTPHEHAVLGPRTCSGGRQSRQERSHIS